MISLLKTFGKGILYVIGAPFFVVALALFGVIGLGAFIFQIIKSIIYFFTGQKFFPELPEDKKLRLMKEAANQEAEEAKTSDVFSPLYEEPKIDSEYEKQEEIQPEPIVIQRINPAPAPQPTQTIEEAVFEDTSSLEDFINDEEEEKQEEPVENKEEIPQEEHTVLETNETPQEEEEEYEELETYVPRSSTYSAADDDEKEDNTDSGVDIFNL